MSHLRTCWILDRMQSLRSYMGFHWLTLGLSLSLKVSNHKKNPRSQGINRMAMRLH